MAHGTCRETMMSIPPLPQEILDYIVDILQDEPQTLRDCCLVAKSWAPRTRKHLFTHVTFNSPSRLDAWKKTFPDHTNSPASYTRSLLVISVGVVITSADVDENSWVLAFSNVVRLTVRNGMRDAGFCNFPLTLRSLCICLVLADLRPYAFPTASRGPGSNKPRGGQRRS